MKEIIYAPLDIAISQDQVSTMLSELLEQPTFYSSYRTCKMIPLFTPGGASSRDEIVSGRLDLKWTREAESCPTLIGFLEKNFLAHIKPLPRIIVLCSEPEGEVKVHIDCSRAGKDQLQHKMRIALSGCLSGLWFLTQENQRMHISGEHRIYVIDGSAPHGMLNESSQPKITVCLGAPWTGQGDAWYSELLKRSILKFQEFVITREMIGWPKTEIPYQDEFLGAGNGSDSRSSGRVLPRA